MGLRFDFVEGGVDGVHGGDVEPLVVEGRAEEAVGQRAEKVLEDDGRDDGVDAAPVDAVAGVDALADLAHLTRVGRFAEDAHRRRT